MTAAPRKDALRPPSALALDAPIWRRLSWGGTVAFAAALAALVLLGRWQELRIAVCFFVPLVAVLLIPHGLPDLLLATIVAAFLLSAAGWAWDWYARWWWFDVLLHTINPAVIMTGSMFMLWKAGFLRHAPGRGRFVLWSTAFGTVLGVGWELFEFTYLPLTWPDTLLDLLMNGAGAALGGWATILIIDRRGQEPVGRRPFLASRRSARGRPPPDAGCKLRR